MQIDKEIQEKLNLESNPQQNARVEELEHLIRSAKTTLHELQLKVKEKDL